MGRVKVAVVRGGTSPEYDVSLKSGGHILRNLPHRYHPQDILIARDGTWHMAGAPIYPEALAQKSDVVFNALHGSYGEDGKVQQIFEILGLPYTGSDVIASALGMNKILARDAFFRYELKLPRADTVSAYEPAEEAAHRVFRSIGPPWIVKPSSAGSSIGVGLARSLAELGDSIREARKHSEKILIEEFIGGREATVCVVDALKGGRIHALPPIEIRKPPGRPIFDYEFKYGGEAEEICPGDFDLSTRLLLETLAMTAHEAIGARHYSRSDFIISPKLGIYLLEINTLPGLTEESLLLKALAAIGCPFGDFLDHILTLALRGK